jgi:Trp operon repressor
MSDLLAQDAIVQAPDAPALEAQLLQLLSSTDERKALGERATCAVQKRVGATPRIVRDILNHL